MKTGCRNKKTNKLFLFIKYLGKDCVINPVGKVVDYNTKLFTDYEDFKEKLFTKEQIAKERELNNSREQSKWNSDKYSDAPPRKDEMFGMIIDFEEIQQFHILHVIYNECFCKILESNDKVKQPGHLDEMIKSLQGVFSQLYMPCTVWENVIGHRFNITIDELNKHLKKHFPLTRINATYKSEMINLGDFKKAA